MTEGLQMIRDGDGPAQLEFTCPADVVVDEWLMMSSPLPVVAILAAYLYFVLHLGPKLMENRKPFKLKVLLVLYNLYNVVLSSYMCWQLVGDMTAMRCLYDHICVSMERSINPYLYKMNAFGWIYFFSKIVELADTVFFVLRKKQNQVTILHVYHHVNMVAGTWVVLKYIRGEQALLIGFINCFVHVIMYSYYLLAALGPRVQKYLWWKKYITKLQLGQFVLVLLYCSYLLINDCRFPKGFTYYVFFQTIVFFGLFLNFYRKTYFKKKESVKVKES